MVIIRHDVVYCLVDVICLMYDAICQQKRVARWLNSVSPPSHLHTFLGHVYNQIYGIVLVLQEKYHI